MPHQHRYSNREEIANESIDEQKESQLRDAFERTKYADWIGDSVAVRFNIDGEIDSSAAYISSALDHEHIFTGVSSYMNGNDENEGRIASGTVRDVETDDKIRADIFHGHILITPRSENCSFKTFRDYCLYLENKFRVTLDPA